MAGRIAKTATAGKPKASSKAAVRGKAPAKPKASAKPRAKAKAAAKVKAVAKKTAQKSPSKKAPAKKPAAKKIPSKKAPAKKIASKKTAAKKSSLKKVGLKKTSPKKPVAKKTGKAVDKVVAAARSVKKTPQPSRVNVDPKILLELGDLAKFIRAAKREIAAIRPDDVKDEYLPKAADELDAVVQATADATNVIMDACEVVENVMNDVPAEASAKLMDATTSIYEACTFQDITGQRIGKVVTAMKHIEERIDALIAAFGSKRSKAKKKAAPKQPSTPQSAAPKEITDADLLEGPQLGEKAKSQAEIDDLLASFD